MKCISATVYEELAMAIAVSASSSRLAFPGRPGWIIGTADMLMLGINRPLNMTNRTTKEKLLQR